MATNISSSVDKLTSLLGTLEGVANKLGSAKTAAPTPAAAARTTTAKPASGGTDKTELLKSLLPVLLSKMQGTGQAAAPQLGGIPGAQGAANVDILKLQASTAQDVQTRLQMTLFNPATNGGYSQASLASALQFAGLGGGGATSSLGALGGLGGLGGGFGASPMMGGMGGFGMPSGGYSYANDPLGIATMASGQGGLPGLYGIKGITTGNDMSLFSGGGAGNIAIQAGLAASPIAQSLERQAQQAFAEQNNKAALGIQQQIAQLLVQRDQIAQAALMARQQGQDITQMLLMIQQIPMAIQQLQMQSQQLFVKAQQGPLGGLFS